ncbi:MAG TPA: cupin domain-containing protein [Anaerolineales bacterium]|jgi:quercetin dioxygenase-like cupin family protein|nr:cupin domain-containing protein [Anaerolineales bacterium]
MNQIQHVKLAAVPVEAINPKMTRRMVWGERLMATLIEFKAGAVVPTHQHENEQLTYCLSGTMRFTFPDREIMLRGGEVLLIPGNVPHGAEMLEEVVEMDFFSPPRQDWISGTDAYLRR